MFPCGIREQFFPGEAVSFMPRNLQKKCGKLFNVNSIKFLPFIHEDFEPIKVSLKIGKIKDV
jgi:hypothetical protein